MTERDHLYRLIRFEHDFILLAIFGLLKERVDFEMSLLRPLLYVIY